MRLLVFSITFRPFIGGAEIALEEILKRVNGVHATVITAKLDPALPRKEIIEGVVILRVGKGTKLDKYLYIFRAYTLAKNLHKNEPFDAVQALMANYAGIAALFFKQKFQNIPYLLTLQSGDSSFFIWIRTIWFYPLYKRVYTKANYIQAISEHLMYRGRRYGYKGKGSVVPNGVDVEHFSKHKSTEEIAALRIELGIQPEEKVIITTGRNVYKNAVDQLILGFHEWVLKTKTPGKLLIVGVGKNDESLRKLTKSLDIEAQVIFVGEKPHSALPLYLQASDIFIRPSRSEGMGNSFIEALAAGVPIIGTDEGGIIDFLVHKETGLLVDKDNPLSIARAIHTLFTDEALYKKIMVNGRTMVSQKYDWDFIANEMQDIYTNLTKR